MRILSEDSSEYHVLQLPVTLSGCLGWSESFSVSLHSGLRQCRQCTISKALMGRKLVRVTLPFCTPSQAFPSFERRVNSQLVFCVQIRSGQLPRKKRGPYLQSRLDLKLFLRGFPEVNNVSFPALASEYYADKSSIVGRKTGDENENECTTKWPWKPSILNSQEVIFKTWRKHIYRQGVPSYTIYIYKPIDFNISTPIDGSWWGITT